MRCQWEKHYDTITGKVLQAPQPCARPALIGGNYCATHEKYHKRDGLMCDMASGYQCVWCGSLGVRFTLHEDPSAPPITLCTEHAKSLGKALDVVRKRHRSKT